MPYSEATNRTKSLENKQIHFTDGYKRQETGKYTVQNCLLGCTACKMIVDRRFRGAYCLHHQG
jgi:hypothetical protein